MQTNVSNGGIIVSGSALYQYVLCDTSKTYTAAICLSDGTIICSSGVPIENSIGDYNTLWVYESDGNLIFRIGFDGTEHKYVWAALYEGSYDASTLPAYQPKGYAAELAECQRYYRTMPYPVIPCANNPAGTQVYGFLPFRMRIDNPTVSCDTLYYFKGDTNFYSVSSASAASYGVGTRIVFNLSSSVEGNLAGAVAGNGITLNADL